MSLYTSDALILRTYKLGEADRIVVFLTSDRGKRRGVAKGARRTRSRFSGGLEVFTQARVSYVERENRDLVRLNYVEPVLSPLISKNADVLGYAGYFSELVDEWVLEGDPNERLYRRGAAVISALATGASVKRVARYFEYWLLRLQGVYPSVLSCQNCGLELNSCGARVSPREGICICTKCDDEQDGYRLSPDSIDFLLAASSMPPDQLDNVSFTSVAARELMTVHRLLINENLSKELKSARVLNEMNA